MRGDERLEFGDEIAVPTEPELEFDPLAHDGEPKLLEPRDLGAGELLEGELLERRPAPETQRLPQQRERFLRVVARARLGDERLEAVTVQLAGLQAKQVARRPRDDQPALAARLVGLQQPPQVRHVGLDHPGRRLGSLLAPELVDQTLARDDLVRVQEQAEEERALFRGAHLNDAA